MQEMPDRYSSIFINNNGDPNLDIQAPGNENNPVSRRVYEDDRDPFLKQNLLEDIRILRKQDRLKLENQTHMDDPLQSEVETFRSMKLVDLEFTRYAY